MSSVGGNNGSNPFQYIEKTSKSNMCPKDAPVGPLKSNVGFQNNFLERNSLFTGGGYNFSGTSPLLVGFDMGKKNSVSSVSSPVNSNSRSANQIISSLAPLKGEPAKFAAEVNKILNNPQERATLINHFKLNSPENKKDLGIAMFLEAGEGLRADAMAPVGAVMLNRALANNLALAASGKPANVSIAEIIREKGQFAIKADFNIAKKGVGRQDAVRNGASSEVGAVINSLYKGEVGANSKAANAFFFQRAKLTHESFRVIGQAGHSFSQTPSSVQYVNGNSIINQGNRGYSR